MSVTIPFKRGDTFLVEASVSDGEDPQDLTGWTIRSHVRNRTTLVAELTVVVVDALLGTFRLTCAPEDTALWPCKELDCDIEYTTASDQVVSSETFVIEVIEDITRTDEP